VRTGTVRARRAFSAAFVRVMGDAVAAAVDAAIGVAADEIVREMKAEAPKKTGRLANSIRTQRLGEFGYRIKAGGADTKNADGYDYAVAVEFGNHHSPANPFFYPSYRRKKSKAKRLISRGVRDAVGKAAESW
jgi:HK97 gp10 family phage protein